MRIKRISLNKRGIRITISSTKKKIEFKTPNQRLRIPFLLLAVSLSCIIVLYPYLPSVNPQGKYVSVDAPHYEGYLKYSLFSSSERLLSVLAMHAIQIITGASSGLIVRAFPLLLGPLLVLSSYYLTSVTTHDKERALYSALFASTSIIVTVGMFAGFYANWLSISMGMLSLAFIFRYVEEEKKSKLLFACIFLSLTCISHVWNFIFFSGTLLLYLLLHMLKDLIGRQRLDKRRLVAVSLPLGTSLVIVFSMYMIYDFSRVLLIERLTRYIKLYLSNIKVVNVFLLESNLIYVLEALYSGFMSNSFYFALAIIGILTTSHEELSKFFLALLLATSIPFLFYGPNLQGRLLYVLPIHLMCATGVSKIARAMRNKNLRLSSRIFVTISILSSLNYALESMLKLISLI